MSAASSALTGITPQIPITAYQTFINTYSPTDLDTIRRSSVVKQQRIGANTTVVAPYATTFTYADIVKQGAYFSNPTGGLGSGAPQDNGTPNQSVAVGPDHEPVDDYNIMLLNEQEVHINQTGNYTIAYRGSASSIVLSTDNGATYSATDTVVSNGWTILTVPVTQGYRHIQVAVRFTKNNGIAVDPVKGLKVLLPGYNFDSLNPDEIHLYQPFMQQLKRFAVLRFMDFVRTNTEPSASNEKPEGVWANRPTPLNKLTALTGPVGQPWESVIKIGQAAESDIWVNVPALARDEYYTQFANFMFNNMPSGMKIYLEYGNEMWNSQFVQATDLRAEAIALVAGSTDEGIRINYDGVHESTASDFEKGSILNRRLYVDRLVRIIKAFQLAFGNQTDRVRGILTWQIVDPLATESMLEYVRVHYGTPSDYFYATSGAPYFGLTAEAKLLAQQNTLTVDACLDAMEQDSIDHIKLAQFEAHMGIAKRWNLKFIAYEGGPDTYGPDSIEVKRQASNNDRMFEICQSHLNRWSRAGGDLFMWFNAGAGKWTGPYGSWSLVESLSDATGPKLSAMDWASITPALAPVSRHNLTVSSVNEATSTGGVVSIGMNIRPWDQLINLYEDAGYSVKQWVNDKTPGSALNYLVSSPVTHSFNLKLVLQNRDLTAGYINVPIEIVVNGVVQNVTFLNPPQGSDEVQIQSSAPVVLQSGMNAITIVNKILPNSYYVAVFDRLIFD